MGVTLSFFTDLVADLRPLFYADIDPGAQKGNVDYNASMVNIALTTRAIFKISLKTQCFF